MQKESLSELIISSVEANKNKVFIVDRGAYKRKSFTYYQIHENALKICSFFSKKGIKKGDRVIAYIPNSSDYASILWACAFSGVIIVPIDFNTNPEFVRTIHNSLDAKLVFCSVFKSPEKCKNFYQEEMDRIYSGFAPEEIKHKARHSDIFEIVYTSGTTSEPKGVMLTHKNLLANIDSSSRIIDVDVFDYSFLSILPLSHLFEQNIGFFLPMSKGSAIVYPVSKKPSILLQSLKEEEIKAMVAVPLFLDMIKKKVFSEARKNGKEETLKKTLEKAEKMPQFIKKALFRSIRKKFPGLKYLISGGAALDADTERFWSTLGIEVLQGYGLTETSPVLSCNSRAEKKVGSVGKPLSGIEIQLAGDNEIIARGENVFQGYYNNDGETEKVIKDGWFHTGDLGKFDEDGFLFITGRKKNMILSPSGMNVYPEDIEKVLNKLPGIKESVVLGMDNGKVLAGVILSEHKLDHEKILGEANSKLSEHQYLSKIVQWQDEDFPRTTTKKIIRRKVEERIILGKEEHEKTADVLLNILAKICRISPKKISEKSKLASLGLDSVKRIELVTEIEDNFEIEFDEAKINEKTRVSDLRSALKEPSADKAESGISILNSNIFNPLRFLIQQLAFLALLPFYSGKVRGVENLPKENCIIIANHSSMFDTFALFKALPFGYRMNTRSAAAKDFFFKNKITGFFGRMSFNAFGFSRKGNTKQSLKDFSSIINQGKNVLIYPEGTRSRTGKLLDFKEGIGILEWELNVPVVPVKLKGLHDILPVGNIFPKFGKAEVIIGKPITFNRMHSPREITKTLHEMIKKLN